MTKPNNQNSQFPNNLSVVFFGSSKYVIPIIQVLKSIKSRFNLVLVVTTEQNPFDPILSYCLENKIQFISAQQFNNETIRAIKDANASFAVLADFGLIIPQSVLEIFPKGIINIHPSLLPKYRGPTPGQSAILNNEKATGVTIIKLDKKIDHGPILFQKKEEITDEDTAKNLYTKLFKIGADNLYQTIQQYIKGDLKPILQDESKATFTKMISKNDGFIDIQNPPSVNKINRMIRAYSPWPGVFLKTKLSGKEKIIKLLPENKIQVEGKKPISYKDFANGYKEGKLILVKLKLI